MLKRTTRARGRSLYLVMLGSITTFRGFKMLHFQYSKKQTDFNSGPLRFRVQQQRTNSTRVVIFVAGPHTHIEKIKGLVSMSRKDENILALFQK